MSTIHIICLPLQFSNADSQTQLENRVQRFSKILLLESAIALTILPMSCVHIGSLINSIFFDITIPYLN